MKRNVLALGLALGLGMTGTAHAEFIENDIYPGVAVSFRWTLPGGSVETFDLTGAAQIAVTFPTTEGSATDTDGDSLEQVPTKITSLSLSGSSTTLGAISVALNSSLPSLGEIEERVNNTASMLDLPPFTSTGYADSFFDLFFEFSVAGMSLHNTAPARIAALIDHKPVDVGAMAAMLGSFDAVALYDDNGQPTGITVAGAGGSQLVPEPVTLALLGIGLAGIGAARRRKEQ